MNNELLKLKIKRNEEWSLKHNKDASFQDNVIVDGHIFLHVIKEGKYVGLYKHRKI
jgi:hypothetical protein